MSTLKTVLLKIKKVSEKDFQNCYNLMRKQFVDEEEAEDNELDLSSYNIEDLEYALGNTAIIKVKGLTIIHGGSEKKIFAHTSYGWDGGSSITTIGFNIKTLSSNDFGGGPTAYIVELKNESYPGLAFHHHTDLSEIHIFM